MDPTWAGTRVESRLEPGSARLKEEPGGPILAHAGARFRPVAFKLGLIDEDRLIVRPVGLGTRSPLATERSSGRRAGTQVGLLLNEGRVSDCHHPRRSQAPPANFVAR